MRLGVSPYHLLHAAICVSLPDNTLDLFYWFPDLPHYFLQRHKRTAGWMPHRCNTPETSRRTKGWTGSIRHTRHSRLRLPPSSSARPSDSDCIICGVIKKPAPDRGGYYLGDCTVTSSPRLPFSLFIPPLLNKMETVRPAFSWQASETVVARQLNAKFWNPDNSVFQALKVQSKELKIDCEERGSVCGGEWMQMM